MSPVVVSFIALALLYVMGREVQRYPRNTGRLLTPSRCEDFITEEDYAEAIDSWVEIWEAAYKAEDPLEALWKLPARERA